MEMNAITVYKTVSMVKYNFIYDWVSRNAIFLNAETAHESFSINITESCTSS
jgi:hypothetical protein